MIRVAVCDDMHEVVREVDNYLLEYQEQNDLKFCISNFYNAEDLWEFVKSNHCDLIFLDIELGEMNGIELGKLIRKELNDQDIKIIIISAMDGYYQQCFDIQPLNFLLKPIDKAKLFEMIDLTVRLIDDQNHIFVFRTKESTYRLKVKDILYFESYNHNFKVVATNGNYSYRSSFSEIMNQLSDYGFIQVHKSYVINCNQTKNIEYDKIIMANGTEIPIGRDRRKEIRNFFLKLGV
ncbi:MAG: LytTR family DNA-binding domain-containing protein [Firmicutes bacterium]|nr:LytTR family DNA-binding domain-containing protein [Bacillota bacterium]